MLPGLKMVVVVKLIVGPSNLQPNPHVTEQRRQISELMVLQEDASQVVSEKKDIRYCFNEEKTKLNKTFYLVLLMTWVLFCLFNGITA